MAGNKNSGRKDIPPGPGRLPRKFSFKLGDKFAISESTADSHFLPMVLVTVIEIDRKCLVLETNDKNRITIFR